jgi:hypothetical protein
MPSVRLLSFSDNRLLPFSDSDVDFTKIIKNSVESKLAYHGFKYDEQELDLILGNYTFRRTYWCKPQYICIGPVEYDADHITRISEEEDSPDEVPAEVVLFEDPGYRLWLSTRYITAVIDGAQIVNGVSLFENKVDVRSFNVGPKWFRERNLSWPWWEFGNETELREVLGLILEIVVSEGLELLEREVGDVRRHHEKLDQRRMAERERRAPAI